MKSRPESVKMLTTAAMLLKTVNKINLTNLLDKRCKKHTQLHTHVWAHTHTDVQILADTHRDAHTRDNCPEMMAVFA